MIGNPEYIEHWTNKWADLLRPNPYRVGAAWDGGTSRTRRLNFYNLPARSTIRIYTLTGEIVDDTEESVARRRMAKVLERVPKSVAAEARISRGGKPPPTATENNGGVRPPG